MPVCSLAHSNLKARAHWCSSRRGCFPAEPRPDLIDRKSARSRCPWIPSSLQALVNECRSASTAPRLPVGRDATHTPHFALWVNPTGRHKERQASVNCHKCETESQFVLHELSRLEATRLGFPIYRRLMDEMTGLASDQAGGRGDDAETAATSLRARQRNLNWLTTSQSQCTSRRSPHYDQAVGF